MAIKARVTNKTDDFVAEVLHAGRNDYSVQLNTGDCVTGFTQFSVALNWANSTVEQGREEWKLRQAYGQKY